MFKKPVRIKSNTHAKGSDRKLFKDLLLKTFPKLDRTAVDDLLAKKNVINVLRIVTHDETIVQVYMIQKQPMLFDVKGKIFPTVFFLWKFPNVAQSYTTHEQVMTFIKSGADLMLPGVHTPPNNSGLPKYGSVSENDIVYVNFITNQAAVAVGLASQSSGAMVQANGKGKCVNVYHFYGDNLCCLDDTEKCPIPNFGPPEWAKVKSYEDDFPALGSTGTRSVESTNACDNQILTDDHEVVESTKHELVTAEDNVQTSEENGEITVENMDELIIYCFLGAIKYSKSITLPILTSNFFKLHMLPLCPPDKHVDIKKSSYKRLKVFLEKMCEEGLVTVKEIKKGVEAITDINRNHPRFAAFYIDPKDRPKKDDEKEDTIKTDVIESYVITNKVLPLFEPEGHRKDETVMGTEIRRCVTKYIHDNNLQDKNNARLVHPKDILVTICKTEHPMTWEEVIENVCSCMKSCYKVKTANKEILNKGKVSPITMTVATRSGNKKVTLVDNLELFGIHISEFGKECQHGVAASTSINKPADRRNEQLLIQGNQVLFVYKLLTEKYKVPKKYIKGLEYAPKKMK